MNDAYAVKVLTELRDWYSLPRWFERSRPHRAALSCAIRALTGKRPTRRDYHLLKTPKFVARA